MLTYFDLRNVTVLYRPKPRSFPNDLTGKFCLAAVIYVIMGVKQHFPSFKSEHVLFNPHVKGQTRVPLKHVGANAGSWHNRNGPWNPQWMTPGRSSSRCTSYADHHHSIADVLRGNPPKVTAECLKTSVCLRQLKCIKQKKKKPVVQTLLCQALFLCNTMNVWEVCDLSPTCTIHCVVTHKPYTALGAIRAVEAWECCNPEQVKTPLPNDVPSIKQTVPWTFCSSLQGWRRKHKNNLHHCLRHPG